MKFKDILKAIITASLVIGGVAHSLAQDQKPKEMCIQPESAAYMFDFEIGLVVLSVKDCSGTVRYFAVNVHKYVGHPIPALPVKDKEV